MPAFTWVPDGFSTVINFSLDSTLYLFEKEVDPPGWDSGGPIDTTSMRNQALRTAIGKSLLTVGHCMIQAAYDIEALNVFPSMMGLDGNQLLEVVHPTTDIFAFWGFIDKFKPKPNKEGEQPMAEVTFVASNLDDSLNETSPTWNGTPIITIP